MRRRRESEFRFTPKKVESVIIAKCTRVFRLAVHSLQQMLLTNICATQGPSKRVRREDCESVRRAAAVECLMTASDQVRQFFHSNVKLSRISRNIHRMLLETIIFLAKGLEDINTHNLEPFYLYQQSCSHRPTIDF